MLHSCALTSAALFSASQRSGPIRIFLMSIPVICVFMLYNGYSPSWCWLWWIPVLTVIQLAFTYGLSLLVGTCNLFFRDLERLIVIFTMMWFFLTPILYPVATVPPQYRWFLYVNPMASLVICWRQVFLEGTLPLHYFGAAAAWAVLVCVVGQCVYRKLQWRFAEVV